MSNKPMTDREAMDFAIERVREWVDAAFSDWEPNILARLQSIADELEWHDPKVTLPGDGQVVSIVLSNFSPTTIAAQFFARDGDDEEWWSVSGGVPFSTGKIYRWRAVPPFNRKSEA